MSTEDIENHPSFRNAIGMTCYSCGKLVGHLIIKRNGDDKGRGARLEILRLFNDFDVVPVCNDCLMKRGSYIPQEEEDERIHQRFLHKP